MTRWPVALLLLAPGPLAAQGIRLDAGLGVSSGTYLFEERTTTWSLSGGVALELGGFILRGSLPVYLQNSTLISGSGVGRIPTGGSSSGTVADSGAERRGREHPLLSHGAVEVPASATVDYRAALGDPILSLTWWTRGAGRTSLAIGAAVKAPAADTATFGTGQWDAGVTAGMSRALGGRLLAGLDLAYWRLGDLEELELRDPLYATASLGYLGSGGWGGTLLVSGGTTVLQGYDPPITLGAGLHRLAGAQSWSLLSTVGLTETAPDFALGVRWETRLSR